MAFSHILFHLIRQEFSSYSLICLISENIIPRNTWYLMHHPSQGSMHQSEVVLFCTHVSAHTEQVVGECLLQCQIESVGTVSILEGWQTCSCEVKSGLLICLFLHFLTHCYSGAVYNEWEAFESYRNTELINGGRSSSTNQGFQR